MTITANINGSIRQNVARAEAAADRAEAILGEIEGGIIITGEPMGSIDTVPDLVSIDHLSLTNGTVFNVKGYDENGYGGGLFEWRENSEAETDAVNVFCPESLYSTEVSETVTWADILTLPQHYKQLAHTDIVFETFSILHNDDQWASAWWMSGDSWEVGRSYSLLSGGVDEEVTTAPILQCKLGRLRGGGYDQPVQLARSNPSTAVAEDDRTTTVKYKYATGQGRWHRVLSGVSEMTPDMAGARPDDETYDNSLHLHWLHQAMLKDGVPKKAGGTGVYTCRIYRGDIFSGLHLAYRVKAMGAQHAPDANGLTGGIEDFVSKNYLDMGVDQTGNGTLEFLLHMASFASLAAENATGFRTDGMEVDFNLEGNSYWLEDVQGSETYYDASDVSARLRESPTNCGIAIIAQGGRRVLPDMRWYPGELRLIGTAMGSCLIDAADGAVGGHLYAEGSVSGRTVYGGGGFDRIEVTGPTRTSQIALYAGTIGHVYAHSMTENPWPSNADDPTLFGFRSRARDDRVIGEGIYETVGSHRYLGDFAKIPSFSVDWNGTEAIGTARISGEHAELSGGAIKGPRYGQHRMVFSTSGSGNPEPLTGANVHDVRFFNRNHRGVLLWTNLPGQDGRLDRINVTDTLARPNLLLRTHDSTNASWTKTGVTVVADQYKDWFGRTIIDELVESATSGNHCQTQNASLTDDYYVVISCVMVPDTNTWGWMKLGSNDPVFFDADAGEFGFVASTCLDYGSVELNDGGYRVWAIFQATATAATACSFGQSRSGSSASNVTYLGDTGHSMGIGACRVEQYLYRADAQMGPDIIVAGSADTGGQKFTYTPFDVALAGNSRTQPLIELVYGPEPAVANQQALGRQRFSVTNSKFDAYALSIATLTMQDVNATPFDLIIDKCEFNIPSNKWFTSNLSNQECSIYMTDCLIDTFAEADGGVDADFRAFSARVIGRGLRTRDGRRSEFDGIYSVDVVASGAGAGEINDGATSIVFQSPLLWNPLTFSAVPVSDAAAALGVSKVEITGNNHEPTYTITLASAASTGETLEFRLSGAVFPERDLDA